MSVKSTVVASSPPYGFASVTASASAFSIALPDKGEAAALIGGASTVADALLGRGDIVSGIAILDATGESTTASAKFDFAYRGDLLIGLIDFWGAVVANGVEIFQLYSASDDSVINLGSSFGPNIDLTFIGYGEIVVGGAVSKAVPEPSTWAMLLMGFAGLGFVGYRASRRNAVTGLRA